ncbi:MAG: thioredoxin domain-containing protein, partial [Myxococcales bacterium]|nr:thioredoxin domain-containing protein [Myxococcales bacterium]
AERYLDWGWPATAVLTPDARPVLELKGYQDRDSFLALLRELVADRDRGALTGRRDPPEPAPRDADLEALRRAVTAQLDRYYDAAQKGWGGPKKYPLAPAIEHSLLRARARGEERWRDRALESLDRELQLVDPVWGGIYQYSVGGVWTEPHYEKIGALQARSLEALALAYQVTGEARYRDGAHAMRRYLLEFMQDPAGGFYTSQDADLRVAGREPVLGADFYALDDAGRRALGAPRIDQAIYADINGLTIRALARLAALVPPPGASTPEERDDQALAAALKAARRLLDAHRRPGGGLSHGTDQDPLLYLRDQTAAGRAFLELYRLTGDDAWLIEARALADFMLAALEDRARGGFFAHTADPEAVGVFAERRRPLRQNGDAARFLLELHRLLDHTGDPLPYEPAARRAVTAMSAPETVASWGRIVGEYLLAIEDLLASPIDLTVVGDPGDPAAQALWAAALRIYEPRVSVELSPPGARYPKQPAPAVYLCDETTCSRPVREPAAIAEAVAAFVGRGAAQ